jgi:hypothetical protein
MKFTSDDQRKAVMAKLSEGPAPRAATFWARRNPFTWGREWLTRLANRRSTGKVRVGRPPEVAQRQREASALLQAAGYTAGVGKGGVRPQAQVVRREAEARRRALAQLALLGLGTAAVALPAGYLSLRTRAGHRAAQWLRAQTVRGLVSAVRFGRGLVGRRAGQAVGNVAQGLRTAAAGQIERLAGRVTGVANIPEEILRQEAALKSARIAATTAADHARIARDMQSLQARLAQTWTGPGWIDRIDARVQQWARGLFGRLGLPVTGPARRSALRPVAERDVLGDIIARGQRAAGPSWQQKVQDRLQAEQSIETMWRQVRKGRVGRYGATEMVRVRGGVIRRRGGAPPRPGLDLTRPRPTYPSVRVVRSAPPRLTPSAVMARNLRRQQELAARIPTMTEAELKQFAATRGLPGHVVAKIRARFAELERLKKNTPR